MIRTWCAAALVAGSLWAPAASADDLQADLQARRDRLAQALGPETLAIFWSAPPKVYSQDVDYEYRQDSDLFYLTGLTQEETILVLMPGNRTRKAILFVREPNPRREHWNGHILSKEEASGASGIKDVFYTSEFESFLAAIYSRQAYGFRRGQSAGEYDTYFAAIGAGRARLGLRLGARPKPSEPLPDVYEFASRARERFVGVAVDDVTDHVAALRQTKTPFERGVLTRSAEISSEAHMAGMREAAAGKFEYEVEAAIERAYLANGAMNWGYPSIVGSGPNATILHYEASKRQMNPNELLLVDAAASYQGYTVDITRTYPVSGAFTDPQRDIYRLVLEAQEAAMEVARAGNKTADIERASEEVVKRGLLRLGLITDASGDQFRTWYTHGICHWIGLDVHDVGDYERPLGPGMAFTIEPGVYVREQALRDLPDTPENRAFIEKVRSAVQKYKDIGVRIEDSFLLTETGLERLSSRVPRTVDEVETFMKTKGTGGRPTGRPQ
ncbi:MAG: aminopeptidase P N-terminal domain-containing protein [Vicinamibacterales bacterium]